ncbi:LacI family DNA-binding transcriptional regulator [Microbacterium maritypicum]|uniref:LacI family DNA-binding transcriptional regulator n=1 Tax=Microbacterium maritypicum TaxID=33918 RepID=UPI003815E6DF
MQVNKPEGKRLRAPTMADVASMAGVSPQTVSRVIRSHPNVSQVTRMQVEQAIERTGYRRSILARALVTGRSMTLGVLTHESDQYAAAAIMLGVNRAARAHGYFVSAAGTTSVSPQAITDGIEHLRNQGIDGLIVAVPIWDELGLDRVTEGLPTAVIDGSSSAEDDVVALDQELSGRLATRHLLERGHDTVWHVAGPASWKDAAGRTTGWEAALSEAGRPMPPVLHGDWTAESGYRNGLILARMPDATAVFVASDEMAFGVLRALAEEGRRVPEDVSVVGMDDIPLARFAHPPLTTIRQPFEDMGRIAVEHVLAAIDDPEIDRLRVTVQPELIVRQSTIAR